MKGGDFLLWLHLVAFGCFFPGFSFGGGGWGVAFWGWNGWDFSIFVAFCAILGPFCDILRRFGGALGLSRCWALLAGDAPTLTLPLRGRGFFVSVAFWLGLCASAGAGWMGAFLG